MDRCAFLRAVSTVLLVMPLAAEAQPSGKVYRIGALTLAGFNDPDRKAFRDGMRDRGWVEGQNFVVENRSHGGALEQVEALTRELIRLNVDVLLVWGDPIAIAARRVSTTLPIAVVAGGYLVENGLAASLARPGGNVTGNSIYAGFDVWGKYVQLLLEAKPATKTLALVSGWRPPETGAVARSELSRAATRLGITLRRFEVRSRDDVQRAFEAISRQPVDALFVTSDPVIVQWKVRFWNSPRSIAS